MRTPPWTLWTLLLAELSRLVAITGGSVVSVIAFAAAVKPLADGQVEPAGALQVMALLIVPMLQFALPFAGGFSATLAYHRFASENEAMAAMASGLSHRTLLAPAAACGLVLALLMLALSNVVIPSFLLEAKRVVTRDVVAQVITPMINRGRAVRLDDLTVYAESAIEAPLAPADRAAGVVRRVVLEDVFAVQGDPGDPDGAFLSAAQVDLVLLNVPEEDGGDAMAVQLRFAGADGLLPGGRVRGRTMVLRPIRVESALDDDPKFLSYRDLMAARARPRLLSVIETRRRRLAALLAEHLAARDVARALTRDGVVELGRTGETFGVRADSAAVDGPAVRLGGPIVVDAQLAGGVTRRHEAGAGEIRASAHDPATEAPTGRLRLTLELEDVRTFGAGPAPAERAALVTAGLGAPVDRLAQLEALGTDRLVAEALSASGRVEDGRRLARQARKLDERVDRLHREILGKLHERAAYAAACALMVVTGAVMALRLRDRLPLVVYLWSFGPALVALVTIGAGQSMTHAAGASGLLLLWGGVAALGLFTLVQYNALKRPR